MKKGCLFGAGVVVALIAGIVFLALGLTAGAVNEADRFLAMLGEGKTREAYLSASETFRSGQSEESFSIAVKELGLNEFASASWSSRSVENNLATLEGTVTKRQGDTNRLTVNLIKEAGEWKVLALSGPSAGATTEGDALSVPPDNRLRQLSDQTLRDLIAALQAKDCNAFHATISRLWQQQVTAEELLDLLQPLIDRQVDLTEVNEVAPVFDNPPVINDERLLVLAGYYPGNSSRTVFRWKYTYEHPDWKLMGFQMSVVPDVEAIPDADQLQKLVTQSLLDFNSGVEAKDFTDFYGTISKTWQGQTSAEKLAEVFKSFVENQIDISPIQDVSPEFSEPVAIDNNGVMHIRGSYPTQPLRVVFELNYVYERSNWKLLGVSLNLQQ